jgi:glutathione reductase (NADPH)
MWHSRLSSGEVKTVGGTCVNVGCVPKKVMWFGANAATQINNAQGFGFEIDVKKFSWEKLKQGREQYIKNITNWYDGYLEDLGIDYIHGFGKLVDKNTVSVNGETYTAKHIVLSPGGEPVMYSDAMCRIVFVQCLLNDRIKSP